MMGLVGIVIVFVMVFGGYLAAGGKLGIILHALPFEMMMIAGAAAGAFLIGNDAATVKHALRDIPLVFRGPRWKPADYRDLLCLLFSLIRLARQNPLAVEEHVETPAESAIFGRYPRILADAEAVALIGDTLRSTLAEVRAITKKWSSKWSSDHAQLMERLDAQPMVPPQYFVKVNQLQ